MDNIQLTDMDSNISLKKNDRDRGDAHGKVRPSVGDDAEKEDHAVSFDQVLQCQRRADRAAEEEHVCLYAYARDAVYDPGLFCGGSDGGDP